VLKFLFKKMLRRCQSSSIIKSTSISLQRRNFFSSIFGGGKSSETSGEQSDSSPIAAPGEIFVWPPTKNAVDPLKAALQDGGAYVDSRVHWLPYSPEELEIKQQNFLGPPLRMASLTVSEPINNGTLLCCFPIDLCPAPGFVRQTPELIPLFDNVQTAYNATVGEATFALTEEAICSIMLMTFGVIAEGPLQKLFQAISVVENIDSRWELLDIGGEKRRGKQPKKCCDDPNHDHQHQHDDDEPHDAKAVEAYVNQLSTCLPAGHERYFKNLLEARMQVFEQVHKDSFGKGTRFEGACQFEDFCTIASLFQSRSVPVEDEVADALHGKNVYVPFYDAADHDAEQPDCIKLKLFKNPSMGSIPESLDVNKRGKMVTSGKVPNYVTPACQMSPACIGVYADRDLIPKQPITRNFGREYSKFRHQANLYWLLHHGSVPWNFPEGNK
jgi:hypothetical protein